MNDKKRKKRDVEVSKEVATNGFQTNSLQGNHVRDLIRGNVRDLIKEIETNSTEDFNDSVSQKK